MNPTYDYSKPKPAAPPAAPPPTTRRRPPKGLLAALAVAVLVLGGAVVAVSRSGGKPQATVPDARFCRLSAQLVEALGRAGVPSIGPVPESVGPEAIKQALDGMGGTLAELQATAPPRVRGDVERVVASLREAAAGKPAASRSAAFTTAEKRIALAQQPPTACPVTAGQASGDG